MGVLAPGRGLSLLLAACASGPDAVPDSPDDTLRDTAPADVDTVPDEVDEPPAPPSPSAALIAELPEVVAATARLLWTLDIGPSERAVAVLWANVIPGCTEVVDDPRTPSLRSSLCRSNGVTCNGVAYRDVAADQEIRGDGAAALASLVTAMGGDPSSIDGAQSVGSHQMGWYTVTDEIGMLARIDGDFRMQRADLPQLHLETVWLDGAAWQRDEPATTWSGAGVYTNRLDVRRVSDPTGRAELTADGQLSGIGEAITAVDLVGARLSAGGGCTLEPGGAWSLRDANGSWFELRFDDVCDGCGALTSYGVDAGTVCVDVQATRPAR